MEIEGAPSKQSPTFITEIFYLTYMALHIGVLRVIPRHQHTVQQYTELKVALKHLMEQQSRWDVRAVHWFLFHYAQH